MESKSKEKSRQETKSTHQAEKMEMKPAFATRLSRLQMIPLADRKNQSHDLMPRSLVYSQYITTLRKQRKAARKEKVSYLQDSTHFTAFQLKQEFKNNSILAST